MTHRHLRLSILPLLACAPALARHEATTQRQAAPQGNTAAPPPVLAATSLPATVLSHCLFGLDPHDPAVQPWPSGPDPRGYQLSLSSPLHLLRWLGFQDEDIVTSVNGHPLGSAERHYDARQATQSATHCRWEILRADIPAVVEATITSAAPEPLVLERDAQGSPVRLSRGALQQRITDPYAFGPYVSMLAMAADDGVYLVDKGLVALVGELGFQPLDHHIAIAGVSLDGGRAVLEGLTHALTDAELTWSYRRGGVATTLTIRIEGDPLVVPPLPPTTPKPPSPTTPRG